MALACLSCGTDKSLKMCARCRSAHYCSPACQKRAWATHKEHCVPPPAASIAVVVPHPDPLDDAVRKNYASRATVSPSSPTRLAEPALRAALGALQHTRYFFAGEYALPATEKRFLATVHVLTCISFFAWHKDAGGNVAALGAHVPIGALLYGCRRQRTLMHQPPLHEVREALVRTFSDRPIADVQVHVLGGHQATDLDAALKSYFPGESAKWRFSWHVLDCLRSAGFQRIDASLMNVFPGVPLHRIDEFQLCARNMRFCIAGLDLFTGCLVTQTDHRYLLDPNDESPVPDAVLALERAVYSGMTPFGAALKNAPER